MNYKFCDCKYVGHEYGGDEILGATGGGVHALAWCNKFWGGFELPQDVL